MRLAGGLAVEVGDTTVGEAALPGRQGRLLLAYLVCNRGRPVPRTELADMLWAGSPPPAWEASLSAVVSRLRTALGAPDAEPLVAGVLGSYQFSSTASVDIDDAAQKLAEAEDALRRGASEPARHAAAAAADVARRPLLAGHEGAWLDEQRARLRALHVRALEALSRACADCGDPTAALQAAETVLWLEPFRETAYRLVIRAHVAVGNRAEALRAYERCRAMLADELGVDPSPQTEACYLEALRLAEPAPTGAEPVAVPQLPLPTPLAAPDRGAFVGRSVQLTRLVGLLDRAGGPAHLAFVTGEPGIGKTRLATEFAKRAHAGGATVLFGRCDAERIVPYQPFVLALRHVVAHSSARTISGLTGLWAAELARLVPELGDRLPGLAEPLAAQDDTARYRLFEAVAATLAGLSRRTPLVLVVDDLHWADQPTLLLLQHVLRFDESGSLLVVGTCRDGEIGPGHLLTATLADLHRDELIISVPLGRLDLDDVTAMLADRGALAADVHRATAGNPLFVRALARHLEETDAADLAAAGIPTGVSDIVRRRLAALGTEVQRSLVTAAVIGRRFGLDVVAAATGRTEAETLAELEDAVAAGLIAESSEPGSFAFVHDLVREAVYGELGVSRRALLHRAVGQACETVVPDGAAELARHFQAAGPGFTDKAVGYAVQAAEVATAQLAHEDAARHYQSALAALPPSAADDARRGRLQLALGEAQARAGQPDLAAEAFAAAAECARATDDAELLARSALGTAATWSWTGVMDHRRIALLDEAIQAVGPQHRELRALLLASLASAHYWDSDPQPRVRLSTEAVDVARRGADPATLATCLDARNYAQWGPDGAAERQRSSGEIVALAQRAGQPELALAGHSWGVSAALELGDPVALDRSLAAYIALADQLRQPRYRWYGRSRQATRAMVAGDYTEAERHATEGREIAERAGEPDAFNVWTGNLLPLWIERPDPANVAIGDRRWKDFEAWFGEDSPQAITTRCGSFLQHTLAGELDMAARLLRTSYLDDPRRLPFDFHWAFNVCCLSYAAVRMGDAERGAVLRKLIAPFAPQGVIWGGGVAFMGSFALWLGMLDGLIGRPDEAQTQLDTALDFHTRLGARPWIARTQLERARLHIAAGDPATAQPLLREVAHTADELGMPVLAADVAKLSGAERTHVQRL